ncbi:hypothetical protein BH20VER3_BH20VER3_02180 [soil metagenome]
MQAYYHDEFSSDLRRFMPRADVPYFGHSWQFDCGGLDVIPPGRRAKFLIALYITVLVDQGMHAHFPALYAKFERLTRYPKFCHGLGQFQKNPREILDVPIEKGLVSLDDLTSVTSNAMELFVDEVLDFSQHHMPELNPKSFFEKLIYDPDVQIPLLVVMADPTVKEMPAWRAYESLRETVSNRWSREQRE